MAMFDQFLKKADELLASEQSFAIAVVVRYESPISGKPGNKAIIFPDGRIWGWIGGGCAQPVVAKEALKALADGQPRLIRISPSASPEEGIVDYTMTCHSGGTLDIYIEPVLPKPHLVILGSSPVAITLTKLAKAINYTVSVAAPEADRESFPDADLLQTDLDLRGLKITPQTLIVVSTFVCPMTRAMIFSRAPCSCAHVDHVRRNVIHVVRRRSSAAHVGNTHRRNTLWARSVCQTESQRLGDRDRSFPRAVSTSRSRAALPRRAEYPDGSPRSSACRTRPRRRPPEPSGIYAD